MKDQNFHMALLITLTAASGLVFGFIIGLRSGAAYERAKVRIETKRLTGELKESSDLLAVAVEKNKQTGEDSGQGTVRPK